MIGFAISSIAFLRLVSQPFLAARERILACLVFQPFFKASERAFAFLCKRALAASERAFAFLCERALAPFLLLAMLQSLRSLCVAIIASTTARHRDFGNALVVNIGKPRIALLENAGLAFLLNWFSVIIGFALYQNVIKLSRRFFSVLDERPTLFAFRNL
jgi:hypothetical protein